MIEHLRTAAISHDLRRTVAEVIYESKTKRRLNWNRIHPKEGDFWMARAAQAMADEGHRWAISEASLRIAETRIEANARGEGLC